MESNVSITGGNRFINDREGTVVDVNGHLDIPLAIPKSIADQYPEYVDMYKEYLENALNELKETFDKKFNFEFENDFTFILENPKGRKQKSKKKPKKKDEPYKCKCGVTHKPGSKIYDEHKNL